MTVDGNSGNTLCRSGLMWAREGESILRSNKQTELTEVLRRAGAIREQRYVACGKGDYNTHPCPKLMVHSILVLRDHSKSQECVVVVD